MKIMVTTVSLIWLLTLGAFAGTAQTLTCTFQFTGSGTLGTQAFTNAALTVTTVADTENRQTSGGGIGYYINNTSASISIAGVGTFQFKAPPPTAVMISPPNAAPGATVTEEFLLGFQNMSGAMVAGAYLSTANPWNMLSSIGPITASGSLLQWNSFSPITSGGTVNLYSANISLTFQATFSGTPPTPTLTRSGVLSQIAAGGGWTTVMTLVNTSSAAVPVTVALHGDDGSALTLPVTTTQQGVSQRTTTSSVNATIKPNATLLISVGDQVASTVTGWADVLSTRSLGGYAIFRSTPQTGSPSEGTVPLQSQFPSTISLPYDNTAGFVMGVALANLSTSFASVAVTMWDESGNQLGNQNLNMSGSGHTAFVLPNQFPLTAGKRGIVKFQATGGITGLGLRFSPFGTFTSVPTM
jgi:hypothetical protein